MRLPTIPVAANQVLSCTLTHTAPAGSISVTGPMPPCCYTSGSARTTPLSSRFASSPPMVLWYALPQSHVYFRRIETDGASQAWSIIAFSNAVVLHKWQHIVSVFIHLAPMVLTYGLRWCILLRCLASLPLRIQSLCRHFSIASSQS